MATNLERIINGLNRLSTQKSNLITNLKKAGLTINANSTFEQIAAATSNMTIGEGSSSSSEDSASDRWFQTWAINSNSLLENFGEDYLNVIFSIEQPTIDQLDFDKFNIWIQITEEQEETLKDKYGDDLSQSLNYIAVGKEWEQVFYDSSLFTYRIMDNDNLKTILLPYLYFDNNGNQYGGGINGDRWENYMKPFLVEEISDEEMYLYEPSISFTDDFFPMFILNIENKTIQYIGNSFIPTDDTISQRTITKLIRHGDNLLVEMWEGETYNSYRSLYLYNRIEDTLTFICNAQGVSSRSDGDIKLYNNDFYYINDNKVFFIAPGKGSLGGYSSFYVNNTLACYDIKEGTIEKFLDLTSYSGWSELQNATLRLHIDENEHIHCLMCQWHSIWYDEFNMNKEHLKSATCEIEWNEEADSGYYLFNDNNNTDGAWFQSNDTMIKVTCNNNDYLLFTDGHKSIFSFNITTQELNEIIITDNYMFRDNTIDNISLNFGDFDYSFKIDDITNKIYLITERGDLFYIDMNKAEWTQDLTIYTDSIYNWYGNNNSNPFSINHTTTISNGIITIPNIFYPYCDDSYTEDYDNTIRGIIYHNLKTKIPQDLDFTISSIKENKINVAIYTIYPWDTGYSHIYLTNDIQVVFLGEDNQMFSTEDNFMCNNFTNIYILASDFSLKSPHWEWAWSSDGSSPEENNFAPGTSNEMLTKIDFPEVEIAL